MLALAGLLALCGAAPADGDLRRLFPRAAALEAAGAEGSLWRLELPAEVLAACRADLSDLRLLDERGAQVPFVIDPGKGGGKDSGKNSGKNSGGAAAQTGGTPLRRVPASVLGKQHHESRSQTAPSVIEELYELRSPPPAPAGAAWQLVAETDAASFVRELVLQSGTLAKPAAELARSTLFRLRDAHAERLSVPLPALEGARFLLRWTGESGVAFEPRWVFEAFERVPSERVALVPLQLREQRTEGSAQHFQLLRPPGIVPSGLRIETRTLAFERALQVQDRGQGSQPGGLGGGYVFRLPGAAEGEELELPLTEASGQWLDVSMDNEDGPALEALSFSAVIRTPSLVFSLPPPATGRTVQLYFGGGRATAPRYDLDRLLRRQRGAVNGGAVGGGALGAERVELSAARLAELHDNPVFDRAPVLEFALHAGAVVDERLYAHQRTLQIASAPDGLARIALEAADIAALRPDLGDLRVVDAAGQQWPYLLEQARRFEALALTVGEASGTQRSHRTLGLPVLPLAPSTLLLEPIDRYFDRPYRLLGRGEGGERIDLASGHLTRSLGEPSHLNDAAGAAIEIELHVARVASLDLEVEDGDNAPLGWTSVRARVELPDLYLLAPPGQYRLLLGNPSEAAPSYDIERARELVLSVASQEQQLGPLLDNPRFRTSARLAAGDGAINVALWGVLVLAVAVLGGLTLRLARQRVRTD